METIKKIGRIVLTTTISTLTSCVVRDAYNKYKNNEAVKTNLKRKFKKINPFKKNKIYVVAKESV